MIYIYHTHLYIYIYIIYNFLCVIRFTHMLWRYLIGPGTTVWYPSKRHQSTQGHTPMESNDDDWYKLNKKTNISWHILYISSTTNFYLHICYSSVQFEIGIHRMKNQGHCCLPSHIYIASVRARMEPLSIQHIGFYHKRDLAHYCIQHCERYTVIVFTESN